MKRTIQEEEEETVYGEEDLLPVQSAEIIVAFQTEKISIVGGFIILLEQKGIECVRSRLKTESLDTCALYPININSKETRIVAIGRKLERGRKKRKKKWKELYLIVGILELKKGERFFESYL